jgi:hypothetical protein
LEILDSLKNKIPFDISLVKDVFKSDMMLAVLKNENTIVLDSLTGILSNLDGFQVILAMPIADKAKFEKLKSSIMPVWDSLSKTENFDMKDPSPVAKYNDDLLVLSLSEAAATAYLNNSGTGEIPESLTAYSQHPMVMDINMREIISQIMNKSRPERRDNESGEILLNTFGNIIMYGGEYENESINTTMEFKIGNKNENSLKQLFMMMSGMIEEKENIFSSDDMESNNNDTITITPVSFNVPNFSDPEVQQFANEYAEYIAEFKAFSNDSAKVAIWSKKIEAWSGKAQTIGMNLSNNPEDARKLSDWLTEMSKQLMPPEEEEDNLPPPTNPPKVKMKKFTPPVIKKE